MSAALRTAERELAALAAHLDTPVAVDDMYRVAVLTLGHRARTLFDAFAQLADGPSPGAALTLVRPMVEINLMLRFLGQDPALLPSSGWRKAIDSVAGRSRGTSGKRNSTIVTRRWKRVSTSS